MVKRTVARFFMVFASFSVYIYSQDLPYVQNLNHDCLICLCHTATKCNLTRNCFAEKGYCGPYRIPRLYWYDAGQVTLPYDDKERNHAYEDCSIHFDCAQKIVKSYIMKYGRDCNGNGVTNCEDYMMLHYNGRHRCQQSMDRSETSREWLRRFESCRPLLVEDFRSS